MKPSHLLKILMGTSKVIKSCAITMREKGRSVLEDHILQGKYVTREEFDSLQQQIKEIKRTHSSN